MIGNKLKELTKDTAIYGISTMVGRFLNFLLVPFYTHFISPADFGIYSNVYAYIGFLTVFYIYGLDAAFMKYASIAGDEKKDVFSTPYMFVTITSLVFSLIILFCKSSIASLMEVPPYFTNLVYYLIFILLFDTLALVPFSNLRLERKTKKFAAIKLGNIFINLALNLILIIKYNYGIEAIFISNLAASIFSFLLLIPEIVKYLKPRIDKAIIKKMLKFGLPYLPASLAAMMVQLIDRPIVLALTDQNTLGIYQANYKLGIFMMLFVQMFQFAWQPFFLINAKDENAKKIFSKVLTLFLLAASLIWIVLTLFIDNIARFEFMHGKSIIDEKYFGGLSIVPIILGAYLFHGMYVNFMAGIYIEEKTKYFPYITGLGALINVVVNYLLIPKIGIMGAALATFTSYFTMAVFLFFVAQKFYKVEYEFAKIFKILFLVIFTGIAYYYLLSINQLYMLTKIIMLFVFIVTLLAFKVLKKEEIYSVGRLLFHRK